MPGTGGADAAGSGSLGRGFLFGAMAALVALVAAMASDSLQVWGKGLMAGGAFLTGWAIERIVHEREEIALGLFFIVVGVAGMAWAWMSFQAAAPRGPGGMAIPSLGQGGQEPGTSGTSSGRPFTTPGSPTRTSEGTTAPRGSATPSAARPTGTVRSNSVGAGTGGSGGNGPTGAVEPRASNEPVKVPMRAVLFENYGSAALPGLAMCLGNPARPESVPSGVVTQTFPVPPGVSAVDAATVQIDLYAPATAHLTISSGGRSTSGSAVPTGDTTFTFPRLAVEPGATVTLTLTFSATQGKLITVYKAGNPGGTFRVDNNCSDGAASLQPSPYGLRARVLGWTG